jgi:hypothetical protein
MQIRYALFWDLTRRRVVIPYRRFGTTYRYVLQESRGQAISPVYKGQLFNVMKYDTGLLWRRSSKFTETWLICQFKRYRILAYWNLHSVIFASAKLRNATISFVMLSVCLSVLSVRPLATALLPLDGFSWNLALECFSKICRENSTYIEIWPEYRVL